MEELERQIREAYIFLREKNMSIPSDTLQFMLDASLEKLKDIRTEEPNYSSEYYNKLFIEKYNKEPEEESKYSLKHDILRIDKDALEVDGNVLELNQIFSNMI